MKWSFLLFSSFLCLQAIAQYPATGNKARLGWQTTGDGLVYRGAIGDTATLDPSGLNNAWMLLDTANGNLYAYRAKAWRLVSGGGGSVSDTLTGEVKGPLDSTYIDTVANIIFTTTTDTTVGVGELEYNDTQGSLVQGLKGGNVTNVIGQQIHQRVTNATGAPLTKGTAVFLHGSQGNRITVRKALATVDSTSANTFGIVAESIADNQSGYVITEGLITNINTNALTEGAAVYLSPTVAGELTTTKPQAPQHTVYIGVCVKQHTGSGELFVKIRNGQELDELHDVRIDSPVSNASLYYNAAQGVWRDTTGAVLTSDTSVFARDFQISGTTNYIPKFTGANTIGNSGFIENGQEVYLGGTANAFNFSRFSIYFNPVNNGLPVVADTRAYNSAQPVRGGWAFAGKYDSIGNYTAFGQIAAYKENTSNQQKNGFLQFSTISNADAFPEERMRITSAGNVGIATSSPSRPLHVNANSSMIIPSGATGTRPASGANGDIRYSTTFNNIEFYDGVRGLWERPLVGTVANNKVAFASGDTLTSNTNFHWDNATTKLGIGNAAPDSTLTVTGGIRTTTSIRTGSDATINGIRVGRGGGNNANSIAIGANALATGSNANIAIGSNALQKNTTGFYNVALGFNALQENTNQANLIAIGVNALQLNTSGYYNVSVGSFSLSKNTSGNNNVAFGGQALENNIDGTYNAALGTQALQSNTSGAYNIAIGSEALKGNISAQYNAAIGTQAMFANTTGANNFALGAFAFRNNTNGANNTIIGNEAGRYHAGGNDVTKLDNSILIGYDARPSAISGNTGEIVIGYQGRGNGSNTTTIGNSSTTATILPAGRLGIAITSPTARLHLPAGTASANTAPLKFTSGTNLTTPEAGAVEWNGTNVFVTNSSATRQTVNQGLTNSATMDFPNTDAQKSSDLTITVTGASDGDVVSLGVSNAAVNANTCYTAWVSAADTVTIRFNNYSSIAVNPAQGNFKVFVTKF